MCEYRRTLRTEVRIRVTRTADAIRPTRRHRAALLGSAVAAFALLAAIPALATTQQARQAKGAFEKPYIQTIETSGRLEGELDQLIGICQRASYVGDKRARAAIWRVVESEAAQADNRWQAWSDGLVKRLPPRAEAVEAAKAGMKPESQADLIEARSELDLAINEHRHQAVDAQIAARRAAAKKCSSAKAAARSVASDEDRGLSHYHRARGLIAAAIQRG